MKNNTAPIPIPASDSRNRPAELRGGEAFLAMLGISFVVVLVALDQTVVGTALPRIVAELKGFALYSWVATSYLLMSAISVPITGRLGDLYGRKWFVLASIVVFTAASVLCGVAQSMLGLVIARSLQGIGGGMLVGTAFASIVDIFPEPLRRIKWQAMLSSAFGMANAIGPTLGGWLTEEWGWRSVFYVNLPIGIVALALIAGWLPRLKGSRKAGSRIDWLGAFLLAVGMGTFLSAFETGASAGLTSLRFWLLLIGAVAVSTLFVYLQRRMEARGAEPIMPMRMFDVRAIRLLSLISLLTGWAMFTLIFYAPLLLQAGFGISPNRTGLLVTPIVVLMSVGSIINGRLYGRLQRPHRLIAIGVLIFAIGLAAATAVPPHIPIGWIAAAFALAGIGLGFHVPNIIIQLQLAAEKRDVGMASALGQTTRLFGSLMGAAIGGVIVSAVYRSGVASAFKTRGVPIDTLGRYFSDPQILVSAVDRVAAHTAAVTVNPAVVDALIESGRAALIGGVHTAFLISIALCALAFVLARKLLPAQPR